MIRLAALMVLLAFQFSTRDTITVSARRPPIVRRIARREGFGRPGLTTKLHNPGALVYAGQIGADLGPRGFARFSTDQEGWIALERDVAAKLHRGVPLKRGWAWMQ